MRWVLPALLAALPSAAASELTPYLAPQLTPLEHARAVSLDVRGLPLSLEDISHVEASGGLDEATLDAWLNSDDFVEQVVRHHKGLFLNNVVFDLDPFRRLRDYGQFGFGVWYVYYLAPTHRGAAMTNCTDYDADVNELNQPQSWLFHPNGGRDEGAVDVNPWWDMDSTIRVCAYDAQLTEVSEAGNDCSTLAGQADIDCGCGPNLIWCANDSSQRDVLDSLSEAVSQRVRDVTRDDQPYSDILTTPSVYLNGPLVNYYRHRVSFSNTLSSPVAAEDLPELMPDDRGSWVEVDVGDQYAGALTEPGWLLRHQTNRGRANRFFSEFLCGEFLPPESGIMEIAEEHPTPDLSRKPVCMSCHTVLEPWAAYWGRWQQVGASYYDEVEWPTYSEECASCAPYCSDAKCRLEYMTRPEHPHEDAFVGYFNPYVFLIGDAVDHPGLGPALWADGIAEDGRLARCAAEKAAIWLLGQREEDISPELIDGWAEDFTDSGMSYRSLIRSIVTSPAYGRAK